MNSDTQMILGNLVSAAVLILWILGILSHWILRKTKVVRLIQLLESENPKDQELAVHILTKRGRTVIGPLIRELRDKKVNVRVWIKISQLLGEMRNDKAVEVLLEALSDVNPDIRAAAVEALGKIGDSRAVKPLVKAVEDNNLYVCCKSVIALWEIGRAFGIDFINDINNEEQRQIISSLGEIRNNRIMERLCLAKDETSLHLQEIAFEALVKFCSVDTVIFGQGVLPQLPLITYLLNPDVIKLTTSLSRLRAVIVDTQTYNFHQVERFITYANNYIGTDYLKNNVEVQVCGDPEKLHQNLWNLFNNFFKVVNVRRYKL